MTLMLIPADTLRFSVCFPSPVAALPLWFDLLHQETTHNPFWFPSTARRPRSSQTLQQLISLIKDVIERVLINEGRCCYFFFLAGLKKKKNHIRRSKVVILF